MYSIYCCLHGIIVVDVESSEFFLDMVKRRGGKVTEADGMLLPSCRTEDELLSQPPLPIQIDDNELRELIGTGERWPVAATAFGPTQDKKRNEDAALSAVIQGPDGTPHVFAAVADGVSTRTFWAERAARVGCLVAYKSVRAIIADGRFGEGDFALTLRETLCRSITEALEQDRAQLKQIAAETTPPGWAPSLYQRYIDRGEFWYNATLLIACLGQKSGVAFWVGDGGLKIVKAGIGDGTENKAVSLVVSTDSVSIDSFISLGGNIAFRGGPISYEGAASVDVYLATDGVDRTRQRCGGLEYEELALSNSQDAYRVIEELWQRPNAEIDNYSVARASWPIGVADAVLGHIPRIAVPPAPETTRPRDTIPAPSMPASDSTAATPSAPKVLLARAPESEQLDPEFQELQFPTTGGPSRHIRGNTESWETNPQTGSHKEPISQEPPEDRAAQATPAIASSLYQDAQVTSSEMNGQEQGVSQESIRDTDDIILHIKRLFETLHEIENKHLWQSSLDGRKRRDIVVHRVFVFSLFFGSDSITKSGIVKIRRTEFWELIGLNDFPDQLLIDKANRMPENNGYAQILKRELLRNENFKEILSGPKTRQKELQRKYWNLLLARSG